MGQEVHTVENGVGDSRVCKREYVDAGEKTGDTQVGGGPFGKDGDAGTDTVDSQVSRGPCVSAGVMSGLGISSWDDGGQEQITGAGGLL